MNYQNVLDVHDIYDDNVHDLLRYEKDELNALDDQGIYDQNVLAIHDLHAHDG